MLGGTREIKVGLFVFMAFILLAVIIFSISDFYAVEPQYMLRIRFNFANGIQVGAPVRVAGVAVGEVRSVRVYRDESTQKMQAELGIRLKREAKIEEDAVAYINTLGLIGEKYLEIISGEPGKRVLSPGEIIVGKDSIPTEQLVESSYRVMARLEQTIDSIHTLISDEGTRTAFKQMMVNSAEASDRLAHLLEQVDEVMTKVREGQGTIGRLLTQDDLYKDLQAITGDLKVHPWKLLYRPKEKK